MIRRTFAIGTALSLLAVVQPAPSTLSAQDRPQYGGTFDDQSRFSNEQLDNLVGSIALYPDALLAQVLIAATFPEQVLDAARWVRANGSRDIDDQSWDISVKSVAHYPSALNLLADRDDWMTTLGQAYANQSGDVMAAVQRMRAMASSQGNLESNAQQIVSREDEQYIIAPAQPRVIYVPVYDPIVIYTRPVFRSAFSSRYWSFGIGFPIGSWLSYDCDWRGRRVYYQGWDRAYFGYGGWRARSYPYIRVTNIYVSPRYRNVYINRDVIRRRVEYRNVDRYSGVHRDTRFGRDGGGYNDRRDNRNGYDPRRVYGTDYRGNDARRDDDRTRGNDRRDNGRNSNDGRDGNSGYNGTGSTGRWSNDGGNRAPSDGGNRGRDDRGDRTQPGGGNSGGNGGGYNGGDRQPTDGINRGGDDRGRRDGSGGLNDRPQQQRNDQPMINPRRVDPLEARPVYTPVQQEQPRNDRSRYLEPRDDRTRNDPPRYEPSRNDQSRNDQSRNDRARNNDRPQYEAPRAQPPRNEQPMINPRRAEPREERPSGASDGGNRGGGDGGRGGERGGRGGNGRGGREPVKF